MLVALGGGVVGDLTGFAASILLRGVPFVQIPTTLLAQVDSGVGGKTGVNSIRGKNLIGSFYQPRLVLADVATLGTLPLRERRAGYAEIVKYGLIDDPAFFTWLEDNGQAVIDGDEDLLRAAVAHACRAKARIVAGDERESGNRALLNLGHTFAHALEAEAGYDGSLLHGEAVAFGIVLAHRLSAMLGHCGADDAVRVAGHFEAVGLPSAAAALSRSGLASAGADRAHAARQEGAGRAHDLRSDAGHRARLPQPACPVRGARHPCSTRPSAPRALQPPANPRPRPTTTRP